MLAGPVRFTVVRRWSRSPRWVSTKASAFLSLQTPWRCAPCSCPSARWDLRLRRSYWWVRPHERLSSDPTTSEGERSCSSSDFIHLEGNPEVVCLFLQGTAQVSLADCEGSADMVYHWLQVQMLSGTEVTRPEQKTLSHRRHLDGQEDEQRPRVMVTTHILDQEITAKWSNNNLTEKYQNTNVALFLTRIFLIPKYSIPYRQYNFTFYKLYMLTAALISTSTYSYTGKIKNKYITKRKLKINK